MQAETIELETSVADLARESLYRFLAAVAAGPYAATWQTLQDENDQLLAVVAAGLVQSEAAREAPLGFGERPPEDLDIASLVAELHRGLDELRADYDRVFGLVVPKECPPYETEFHPSSETFFRSQQLADIAGFYRAFGLDPSSDRPERPDFLALELEFMAFLLLKQRMALASAEWNPHAREQAEVCEQAQRDFARDHLAWWVPAFARGLARKAGDGYLCVLGKVLGAFIALERERLAIAAPEQPVQPGLIERPEEQSGCATCPLLT